tara:strand:+ start:1887 stop:2138 length:252 start_codon:yes stop_codon:yes gene_type:complete
MPRYIYECSKCGGQFQVVHGMSEEQDKCELCFSFTSELKRIPQMTYTASKETQSAQRVKKAIEENREILKQASQEAKGKTYDG